MAEEQEEQSVIMLRDDAWEPQPRALRERGTGRRAVEAVDRGVFVEVMAGGAEEVERR